MKKSTFLDLVCAHLAEHSLPKDEVEKQRVHIDAYLEELGIGEESEELDYEDPKEFADGIFEVIADHLEKSSDETEPDEVIEENYPADDAIIYTGQAAPDEEIIDEDGFAADELSAEYVDETYSDYAQYAPTEIIPVQYADDENVEYSDVEDDYYAEDGEYVEEGEYVDGEEYVETEDYGATREFDVSELSEEEYYDDEGEYEEYPEEEPDEEDYDEDETEEELPAVKGNPALFWVLVAVLSPFWIPIVLLALALVGIVYVVLLAFKFLYIPMIVAVILFGSITALAEFIYGVVKIIGKNPVVGLFELGICFAVIALTIGLTILISMLGTKTAPRAIKKFGKFLKKMKKKIKRAFRKIKGACSI